MNNRELTPQEALLALAEGKKIIHFTETHDWVRLDSHGDLVDSDNACYEIGGFYGFRLYQEPKKKVKMWQWLVRLSGRNNSIELTNFFYSSQEEAQAANQTIAINSEILGKAEWTEIEVEE